MLIKLKTGYIGIYIHQTIYSHTQIYTIEKLYYYTLVNIQVISTKKP
jgi:hypothetical protein